MKDKLKKLEKEQVEDIIKVIISIILLILAIAIPENLKWIKFAMFILSYIIVAFEVLKEAVENIFKGEIFDENFLMSVATIGAFAIGEFPEAVAVMLFYKIGELFEDIAVDNSKKSIAGLMNIRPDFANVERSGKVTRVSPSEVEIGELIVVKPGEKIPLDGVIEEGSSMLDTMALTGEPVPRKVQTDDGVVSGCINKEGVLKIRVTKKFGESTVSKILELVEHASSKKSKSENFITTFAKYYTPTVVIIAVILAIVPPLIISDATFSTWIYRALSFLVVSCPCALVISIPLSFFGGIGGASKMGVLIKGGNYLEALAKAEIMVFDKTGTLTEGIFEVQKVNTFEILPEELLKIVAHVESNSNHPIAQSIKKAYSGKIETNIVEDVREIAGEGISAKFDGRRVLVGNEKLMEQNDIEFTKSSDVGTILYVAIEDKYVGYILIADKIKEDSKQAIQTLKAQGIKQTVMLTGDKKKIGEDVAKNLEIDKVFTELLPDGKVKKVEELMKQKSANGKLVFVGDGINDSPVLALSDIGIAMGGLGSDSAIEVADIVIMTDEVSKISRAINLSKKTMRIVKENITFAILVKVAVLIFSAVGLSTMWEAVFADVGVTVISVLNSLRVLKIVPFYDIIRQRRKNCDI